MLPAKFWAIAIICLTLASPASAQLYDRGTLRDGALLSETASPSATACRSACALDNSCAAWTWERPGEQGPQAMCRLQAEAVAAKPDNCCISGVSPASSPDDVRQLAALEVGAVEARHTIERADGGRDAVMQRPSRDHAPFTRKLTRYAPPAKPASLAEETTIIADASGTEPQIEFSDVAPVKEAAAAAPASDIEAPATPARNETEPGTAVAALEFVPAEQAAPEAGPVTTEPVQAEDEGPVLLAANTPAPAATSSGPAAAFKAAPSRPEPMQPASAESAILPAAPAAEMTAHAASAMPDETEMAVETTETASEAPALEPVHVTTAQAAFLPAPAVEAAPVSSPAPTSGPAPATGARLLPDAVRPEPNPMISTADKRRAGQIPLGEQVALNFDPTASDNDASKETAEEDETSDEDAQAAETPAKSEENGEASSQTVELAESGAPEAQGAGRQGYVHPSQRSAHPRYSVQHEYAAPYPGPTAGN